VRAALVVVASLSLLAFAGILVLAGVREWRLWTVVRRVAPTTPDQLADRARTGRVRRELVAVVGFAGPDRRGPLRSRVNEQPCVWHHHIVYRRRVRRRADGRTRTSWRRRRVADVSTDDPVVLSGAAARVELLPTGIPVDRPMRTATRVLPALVSQPFPDAAELMDGDRYVHREWIIPVRAPLYVLAEATATGGAVTLRKPAAGPRVISTRTVAGLRRHQLTTAATAFALAIVVAVVAVLLLVALL
jgi:E3 Ubiquitin ligase